MCCFVLFAVGFFRRKKYDPDDIMSNGQKYLAKQLADEVERLKQSVKTICELIKSGEKIDKRIALEDDAVIPPGVTAIATTTSRPASVVVASLSDAEADPVPVVINSGTAGLKSISDDHGIVCRWDGSSLIISSGGLMTDVDVVIYTVDGRVAFEKHLSQLDCGDNSIDIMGLIDSNSYYIVALRHNRQILVSQKLTTINR